MSGAEALAGLKVAVLIIGVLSQIVAAVRDYRDYSGRLASIKDELEAAQEDLTDWYNFWGLEFDKEGTIFRELWGEAGFRRVRSEIDKATAQCIKCAEALRKWCSIKVQLHNLTPDHDSVCRDLGIDPEALRNVSIENTGRFQRICGHLVKGEALYKDVHATAKLVAKLRSDSEKAYEGQGFGTAKDSESVDRCRNLIRMRRLATRLYKEIYPYREEFEVLLRLFWPDEMDERQHWSLPRIEFTILELIADSSGKKQRHLVRQCSISAHPTQVTVDAGNVTDPIDMWTFCMLDDDFAFRFESRWYLATKIDGPVEVVYPVRDMFRGRIKRTPLRRLPTRDDRLHSARVLATIIVWYSVLPDTRWFERLHGSGLMWTPFIGYEQDAPDFSQYAGAAKYVFRPWDAENAPNLAPEQRELTPELTCLVSVVSELVMQGRVEYDYSSGKLLFTVPGWGNRQCTWEEFLKDVTDDGGHDVGQARRYCLTPDPRHVHVNGRTIKVEHFASNAVKPLFAFHWRMMQSTTGGIPVRPA